MRKHNTESLGEVLRQFFEENPFFQRKLAESRVISDWGKILGSAVASYTTNIYFRNNILYVHLSSSVLRAELIMVKERIVQNLNTHVGMEVIQDIIFR